MNSKALKEFDRGNWWTNSTLYDLYSRHVANPARRIKKLYDWARFLKDDYDFDGQSIFRMLEFKLKRIQKELLNGHAIHEDQDLAALALAIKLAGRLRNDIYEEIGHDRHDRKWGELESWTTPQQDSDMYTWHSRRKNAVFEKDKKAERLELRAMYEAVGKKRARETAWFYGILAKYTRVWWD